MNNLSFASEKQLENNKNHKYFLAISFEEKVDLYHIYFINDSQENISLLEVESKQSFYVKKQFKNISPKSYIYIESLDMYDFNFSILYELFLYKGDLKQKLKFDLGKRPGVLECEIPIVNKLGRSLYPCI